ncbi:putative pectin methylesterase family protein [Balamuthia mandrillaris]
MSENENNDNNQSSGGAPTVTTNREQPQGSFFNVPLVHLSFSFFVPLPPEEGRTTTPDEQTPSPTSTSSNVEAAPASSHTNEESGNANTRPRRGITVTFTDIPAALVSPRNNPNGRAEHYAVPLFFPVPVGQPQQMPAQGQGFASFQDFLNHTFMLHQLRASTGPPPASKEAVAALPKLHLSLKDLQRQSDCPVCQESFQEEEQVIALPCRHHYHEECLQPWLKQHNTCPVCRYELATDDPDFEEGRKERMAARQREEEAAKQQSEQKARQDEGKKSCCGFSVRKGEECVLLDEKRGGELLRLEACHHRFHRECITAYIRARAGGDEDLSMVPIRCPTCQWFTTLAKEKPEEDDLTCPMDEVKEGTEGDTESPHLKRARTNQQEETEEQMDIEHHPQELERIHL